MADREYAALSHRGAAERAVSDRPRIVRVAPPRPRLERLRRRLAQRQRLALAERTL